MHEAQRAAARRGQLHVPLPVGLVYDQDGNTVIDPDEEVAAAISDVFAAFTAAGSAYAVAGAFTGRRFPRRAYGGIWAGQLRWGTLTHARAVQILHNPAYAGAYVFGRRRSRQAVTPDGQVRTQVTWVDPTQWEVVIPGHHPGYITWEDYQANQQKLAANRTSAGARPPREGTALCQGITYCGGCGQGMSIHHQRGQARYQCQESYRNHVVTPRCASIRADVIDTAVADALLAAVAPAQVELALAAVGEVTARHHRSLRAAELAAERAHYAASRAERAFLACEPENRLVARTLETRWETALADAAQAEAELAARHNAQPELPSPERLAATIADLPALWSAPTTSSKDRKRLLRTLLADVTLTPTTPTQLTIGLRWQSGATQQITVTRPPTIARTRATAPDAIDLARKLGPSTDNTALAAALNQAGHRTGTGQPFTSQSAANLRGSYHIPSPGQLHDGELTTRQVADRIGVSTNTVLRWITTGHLPARPGPVRGPKRAWAIPFPPQTEQACRQRAARSQTAQQSERNAV